MSQITILFLYLGGSAAFAFSRLPAHASRTRTLTFIAVGATVIGLSLHAVTLVASTIGGNGLALSIGDTASMIGLQLALIALIGTVEPALRGMAAGLLVLAAIGAALTGGTPVPGEGGTDAWQIQMHVLISLFAYGLLTAGSIVAVFALIQEQRLRAGQLSAINALFSPLETTEKMLFGIAASGFLVLLLAVSSGFALFDNLFAEHLVHKTTLSLLALLLFGILLAGRQFAGWRGRRAVYLYLWGFFILCLAYFGSRFVLEVILDRSWN